jgi:hypothetical protein
MHTRGNPRVVIISLPDDNVKKYPDDATYEGVAIPTTERSRLRGATVHSRAGQAIQIGYNDGDIGTSNFITLDAGLYKTFGENDQVAYMEFKRGGVAADTVEIEVWDTSIGLTSQP